MDAVFLLDEAARSDILQLLMQSTGCTYICLWSCSFRHQANCLIDKDGCYNDENSTKPGALRLFLEYRQLIFPLENNHGLVPGFAFRNYRPYIELGESELQNRASHPTQRQFYREAGIKTAVFMGCRSGEIELGSPNVLNMEMEMRRFFPVDFSRKSPVAVGDQLPQPTDPNKPSSSSSSLRSLSTGSSDSYLIFTVPSASRPQVPTDETTPSSLQAKATSSSLNDPHQQAMQQALSELRSNIKLPTLESENAAMTKAILAVLTSPSSSSSTSHHPQKSLNLPHNYQLNPKGTVFKRYGSVLNAPTTARASLQAQTMLKRAILFYRNFSLWRREQLLRSSPSVNQLNHMLSERKRREKLKESFDALRSLLPSGTKKDRVSVLTSTREYLTSLKAQIAELSRLNQLLEGQISTTSSEAAEEVSGSSNERLNVQIIPVSESTSQQRIIDLRITVRGEWPIVDILIHLSEFLKRDLNISLMSTEANTHITESGSINHVNLRFRIEGNDWDESTFREAVRRLLADLAQ